MRLPHGKEFVFAFLQFLEVCWDIMCHCYPVLWYLVLQEEDVKRTVDDGTDTRMAGGGRRERRRMVAPGGPKGGKKLVVC